MTKPVAGSTSTLRLPFVSEFAPPLLTGVLCCGGVKSSAMAGGSTMAEPLGAMRTRIEWSPCGWRSTIMFPRTEPSAPSRAAVASISERREEA